MSRELWRAIGEKKQKLASELLKNGRLEVDMTFAHAWTCLHAACERGYTDITRKLLEMGSSPDIVDWNGETALHSAAEHGYVDITKMLLTQNVQQTPNRTGQVPLHFAAKKGQVEALEVLLKSFPNHVNIQDQAGKTPLHEAAQNGHLATVTLLVKSGAKSDLTSGAGETAARLAEVNGHLAVVKFLNQI